MTKQAKYHGATPFSGWLRRQEPISSDKGYVCTDIDFVWRNHKTGAWMILEEKCRGQKPSYSQRTTLALLSWWLKKDPKFKGVHLITFGNTNPEDGRVWIDGKLTDKEGLTQFLQMGWESW